MARAELEAARAWGVPRSIFLGAPWPAPGEPMWTPDDRAWAIALLDLEADTCACGHRRSETTQPEAEGTFQATPVRCHACAAKERTARKFLEGSNEAASDGLHFHVQKK